MVFLNIFSKGEGKATGLPITFTVIVISYRVGNVGKCPYEGVPVTILLDQESLLACIKVHQISKHNYLFFMSLYSLWNQNLCTKLIKRRKLFVFLPWYFVSKVCNPNNKDWTFQKKRSRTEVNLETRLDMIDKGSKIL